MWAWLIPVVWMLFGFGTYRVLKRDWLRHYDWTVEDRNMAIFMGVLTGPIGLITIYFLCLGDQDKVLEKRNDRS